MKFGKLLNRLILHSNLTKTELALEMNMSPSSLSKILSGSQRLSYREKDSFCQSLGDILGRDLYHKNCIQDLKEIFPVLYAFESQFELARFLTHALSFAIRYELAEDSLTSYPQTYRLESVIGTANVLDLFCVILSSYGHKYSQETLDFYSSLPLFGSVHNDLWTRIRYFPLHEERSMTIHQYNSTVTNHFSNITYDLNFIAKLVTMQSYSDLTLYETDEALTSNILLLKDRMAFIISKPTPASVMLSFSDDPIFLENVYNAFMCKQYHKISFNDHDVYQLTHENPQMIHEVMTSNIEAIYDFLPAGCMLEQSELKVMGNIPGLMTFVENIGMGILNQRTHFYTSIRTMEEFLYNGKLYTPFQDPIYLEPQQRRDYLKRFNTVLDNQKYENINVLSLRTPRFIMFVSGIVHVICLVGEDNQYDKVHVIRNAALHQSLQKLIHENSASFLSFTRSSWNQFVDNYSR